MEEGLLIAALFNLGQHNAVERRYNVSVHRWSESSIKICGRETVYRLSRRLFLFIRLAGHEARRAFGFFTCAASLRWWGRNKANDGERGYKPSRISFLPDMGARLSMGTIKGEL